MLEFLRTLTNCQIQRRPAQWSRVLTTTNQEPGAVSRNQVNTVAIFLALSDRLWQGNLGWNYSVAAWSARGEEERK